MFTGIVEEIGTLRRMKPTASSCTLTISCEKVLTGDGRDVTAEYLKGAEEVLRLGKQHFELPCPYFLLWNLQAENTHIP